MIKNINPLIAVSYIGLLISLCISIPHHAYAQDNATANTQANTSKPALKPSKAISSTSVKAASSTNTSSRKGNTIILPNNSPQLVNLKTELVKEMLAPSTSPLNGKIIFDENFTTRIGTPVDGRVTKINVQMGDYVKAGQVLMLMDAPDLGNALADDRKALADLQLKKQARERNKMLFDGGVIAKKSLEGSDADFSQAQAEMERTSSKLKNLGVSSKMSGDSYAVRAPIAGYIVDRQANPGALLRADSPNPIFVISNPDHLWASIDLPERDLSKVYKNQEITIEVDAYPNQTFNGRIKSIGLMVDPTTRRIPVVCVVDGRGQLKPEMYAKITPLNSDKKMVLRIPNSALMTDGLYSYVFVETSTGHFVKTKVTLNSQQIDFSFVKDGLKSGDIIVISGAVLLNSELSADQ